MAPDSSEAQGSFYQNLPILVSTMNDVPGYNITEVFGEVYGLVVRARNIFSNIGASFRGIVGGEAKGYTKLLADSREQAVQRMVAAAQERGANAIIAMRFDSGELVQGMNELLAYGTAVSIQKV